MTKLRLLLTAILLTALTASAGGSTATAARPSAPPTVAAADPNCAGYGTGALLAAAYIKTLESTPRAIGAVQMCRRPVNGKYLYYGWVILYQQLGTGEHGNGLVRLYNPNDGREYTFACSDPNGTGAIIAPKTRCTTPGLSQSASGAPYVFNAEGYVYKSNGVIIASGGTTGAG
ncbi:hypothetical protein [Kribbella sp. CA-294648]|uniref:hypothetical protein n=1 Tax=Kribbella sp. CA-294648 TaxID=3239948 RepID=UPI003D927929